jgi:trimeric autotransporter adhesin
MKSKPHRSLIVLATLALSTLNFELSTALAQGTAFIYQGQLMDSGAPANGLYDLQFSIYNTNLGGTPAGPILTNAATAVSNGLFTVTLDFGAGIFTGSDEWLDIAARTNGAGTFTELSPRQPLTPTPYAIFANTASNLLGTLPVAQLLGSINGSTITLGTISAAQIATNQVVTSLNKLRNDVTIQAGTNVAINVNTSSGTNALVISASASAGAGGDWLLTGNAGTQSGVNFLGTTDDETLEFRVQNTRAFHLEPGFLGDFGPAVPNVIGGSTNNSTAGSDEVEGATIGGGDSNTVAMRYATIAGGQGNYISDLSPYSSIGGGMNNTNFAAYSTIVGGLNNDIQNLGTYSTIGGGRFNKLVTNAFGSMIGGGEYNVIDDAAFDSTIAGGSENYVGTEAADATISGGYTNIIGSSCISSTIGGGFYNTIGDYCSYSTIGGGHSNLVGVTALSPLTHSTIAGGLGNSITSSSSASISGGADNNIDSADWATIGGGSENAVLADSAVIGGGDMNTISDQSAGSVICGGEGNGISTNATSAAVLGGEENHIGAGASYTTIAGGYFNVAAGEGSFAAGEYASATNDNTFVWSDGSEFFSSVLGAQFLILAHNGVGINKNNPNPQYALDVKGAINADGLVAQNVDISNNITCATVVASESVMAPNLEYNSDRNLKENFLPVSAEGILVKVAALPISRWNFRNDKAVEHIGPMAQDFHSAFNVGPDDRHITTVDEGGVALAAIQGLNQKLEETQQAVKTKDSEIQSLKQQNELLAVRFEELEATVRELAARK